MQENGIPYGIVEDAEIVVEDGLVSRIGKRHPVSGSTEHSDVHDLGGAIVTPALMDCHTHLVFGGNRAREFELRLQGAGYEQIAREGGGILSTMEATRATCDETLLADALKRVDALLAEGVATIEVKSGYGLSIESELRMLRVARKIADERDVHICTSWLAAHALPPEYSGNPDAYIEEVAIEGLRAAHAEGLVDAVDGFCEGIAFSPEQISRLFDIARDLELPVKLHAEQLSNLGGARLAARYGALSADHLEYLDGAGIEGMRSSGTTAVLLPGAYYTLRSDRVPPVEQLRDLGVPMAVASDGNPGSSPMFSVLLAVNMASTLFRLTPEESLAGVTRNAARALGMADRAGTIEPGKRADLAIWDIKSPSELAYRVGFNPLLLRVFGGKPC